MSYKIIALVGESGSGKDTMMQEVLNKYPNNFNEIISCTSRPKREGEIEGKNYFFLTAKHFTELYDLGLMLEATNFNGWYYGTNKNSLSEKKINIGVFNPEGIRSLIKHPDVELIIFKIECSPKTRLLRQLNREENPDVEEIIRRYKTDEKDFKQFSENINSIKINNDEIEELALGADYIVRVSKTIFS